MTNNLGDRLRGTKLAGNSRRPVTREFARPHVRPNQQRQVRPQQNMPANNSAPTSSREPEQQPAPQEKSLANRHPQLQRQHVTGTQQQPQSQPAINNRPQPPKPTPQPDDKEIRTNQSLAELFTNEVPMRGEKTSLKKSLQNHKKKLFIAGGTLAGLVLMIGAFAYIFKWQTDTAARQNESSSPTAKKVGYNPLIPLGEVAGTGIQLEDSEVFVDESKKVLGYSTEYNGSAMTITQQPLPSSFKDDPESGLKKIADNLNADKQIETQKGPAFIATNENSGEQTAVFAGSESLVFVRSAEELVSDDDWEFFINQLSPDI